MKPYRSLFFCYFLLATLSVLVEGSNEALDVVVRAAPQNNDPILPGSGGDGGTGGTSGTGGGTGGTGGTGAGTGAGGTGGNTGNSGQQQAGGGSSSTSSTSTTPTSTSTTSTSSTSTSPPTTPTTTSTNSTPTDTQPTQSPPSSTSNQQTQQQSSTQQSQTSNTQSPASNTNSANTPSQTPTSSSNNSTSPPPATTSQADNSGGGSSSGFGTGSIIGLSVAGGVAVLGIIGFFIWKFTRKRFTDFDDHEAIKWPELNSHTNNEHALPVHNTGRSGFDTGSEVSLTRTETGTYSDFPAGGDPYAVPPLPHLNPNQPYRDDPSGFYDPYKGPVPNTLEQSGEWHGAEAIPMTQMRGPSPGPQMAYDPTGRSTTPMAYDAGGRSTPVAAGRMSPGPAAAYGRASPGPQMAYGRSSPGPQAAYDMYGQR